MQARRMMAAAVMALCRRVMFNMAVIWAKPLSASPTSSAYAPSSVTSPVAMARVPSLSFKRSIR